MNISLRRYDVKEVLDDTAANMKQLAASTAPKLIAHELN